MTAQAWDKVESISFAFIFTIAIATVILGIATMFYRTGVYTHEYEMALIEKCAVEYRFDNGVHWVYREYCGGTVAERVQVVAVQTPVTQQSTTQK